MLSLLNPDMRQVIKKVLILSNKVLEESFKAEKIIDTIDSIIKDYGDRFEKGEVNVETIQEFARKLEVLIPKFIETIENQMVSIKDLYKYIIENTEQTGKIIGSEYVEEISRIIKSFGKLISIIDILEDIDIILTYYSMYEEIPHRERMEYDIIKNLIRRFSLVLNDYKHFLNEVVEVIHMIKSLVSRTILEKYIPRYKVSRK